MERKEYRKRQPQVLCDCPNEMIYPIKIRKNFVDNFVEKRRKTGFFKHKDQVVHNKQERQIKISTGKNAVFSGNFGKRMGKFRG